jgi:hypothetical protein
MIRAKHYMVTRYWLAYFVNKDMVTFCICPNGQTLRAYS